MYWRECTSYASTQPKIPPTIELPSLSSSLPATHTTLFYCNHIPARERFPQLIQTFFWKISQRSVHPPSLSSLDKYISKSREKVMFFVGSEFGNDPPPLQQISTGSLRLLEYCMWSGDGWSSFQILQWRISLLWSKLEFDGRKPPKFWQYLLFLLFLIIVNQLHVLLLPPVPHLDTLLAESQTRPEHK